MVLFDPMAAHWRGVYPWDVRASMFAPWSNSFEAIEVLFEYLACSWSNVSPCLFQTLTSAPPIRSKSKAVQFPFQAAYCKAVGPAKSGLRHEHSVAEVKK